MGREVTLDSEMLAKVSGDRSFKSVWGGVIAWGTCRGAETDAAIAGFTERGMAGKDFDPGIIVRRRTLCQRNCGRAHQNNHTQERNQLFHCLRDCLRHSLFSLRKEI